MIENKGANIPIITHDPYFSIWAPAPHLYDADLQHWSGLRQKIRGYLTVDGATYCFLGDRTFHQTIPQTGILVTATSTEYTFENEKVQMRVKFTSPLLADDLLLLSRPCSYLDFSVTLKAAEHAAVDLVVSDDLVCLHKRKICGAAMIRPEEKDHPAFQFAYMGPGVQTPLGHSADRITIDWGYVYLAARQGEVTYDRENQQVRGHLDLSNGEKTLILAYDDLLSINYMGQWRKAYWTGTYKSILDAIGAAFADQKDTMQRAAAFDEAMERDAERCGGREYAQLCGMLYRQTIAGHKLVTDEQGNVLFFSKENSSNGCIGTVDVSYPTCPLFLLYNPECVKGMLRPVFEFAEAPAWPYDFAPHDVGQYPYAWGQVYGLKEYSEYDCSEAVYPPIYQFPRGCDLYRPELQMPVEECGNMLIMTAAVCLKDGNAEFAKPYLGLLEKWVAYLKEFGADPGEQLCTDDFAGHMSHNTNLAVKAIMGIEAYAQILTLLGRQEEAASHHTLAGEMAADWEKRARAGDHYALAFGNEESWSLKYNLIWDKLFGSHLFPEEVFDREVQYYLGRSNRYGIPLDNRADYTKSDWLVWCAALAACPEDAGQMLAPLYRCLMETESKVPFSDWYDTTTGKTCGFRGRPVQGGVFMLMLAAGTGN